MELKWTILCFLAAVFILGNSLNWMAGGTFTQEEFATLRAKVDNFNKASTDSELAPAAKTMSNQLNTLWAPAWNVVIVYFRNGNYDAVLYGYGFNNRWFWFNGFLLTSGKYISFIIWKDFNCVSWIDHDPMAGYYVPSWSYSDAVASKIQSTLQADSSLAIRDLSDIWKVAQHIQSKVPTTSATLLQDPLGYTVIASASSGIDFLGRFCVSGFTIAYSFGKLNGVGLADGKALILQMRSS